MSKKYQKLLQQYCPILCFVTMVVIFSICFCANTFHLVSPNAWATYNSFNVHEFNIIVAGRVHYSMHHGLFSYAGLLGTYNQTGYHVYMSQIGGQALIYGIIAKTLSYFGIGYMATLKAMKIIVAVLLACSLSTVVLWIGKEFGIFVAAAVFYISLYSLWLTMMATNLYWILFIYYAPMCLAIWYYRYNASFEMVNKKRIVVYLLLIFVVVLFKCASGFEFATALFFSMLAPYAYFAIRDKWSLKYSIFQLFLVVSVFLCAVVVALLLTFYVLGEGTGQGFHVGMMHMYQRLLVRTHASNIHTISKEYWASYNATTWGVIKIYINTHYDRFYVPIKSIIEASLGAAILGSVLVQSPLLGNMKQKMFGLIGMTFVALLAPLSWLIIAKNHAYIHTFIDPVLWTLPFTVVGFALILFVIKCGCQYLIAKTKEISAR